jgi:hypothetical protein
MLNFIQRQSGIIRNFSAGNLIYLRLLVIVTGLGLVSMQSVKAQDLPRTNDEKIRVELQDTIVDDTDRRYVDHSPQKATLLSATLPGMGQIYNGKFWKVPIIYAGFGAIGYFVNFNNTNYQLFRRAYLARVDGNPNTVPDERFEVYRTESLRSGMNFYRRNLEISYISAVALYVLNILDATVDAHLLDFDVGEDLTFNIRPSIVYPELGRFQRPAPGFKLTFRL